MGLPTQTVSFPLGVGLDTKSDERVMKAPSLSVCKDVEFEEIGGLQTRKPFAAITNHASNTIADIRRVAVYGDELVAFTKDAIWSYSSGDGLWTQREEYLAVKVEEKSRFVTTGSQYDCDRAEHSGVVMFSWTQETPSGTKSYVAALDAETGSVKLSPTEIKTSAVKPRLVVTTNCIVLVYSVSTTIWIRTYDPSDLSSNETNLNQTGLVAFDVIQDPSTPARVIIVSSKATSYSAFKYTETPAQAVSSNKARTSSGAISVAFDATDGNSICVTRHNGTAIESDFLVGSSLADATAGISVGTASSATVNQITSVFDESNVCHVFWSAGEDTSSTSFQLETNTVTSAGTTGTESDVVLRCGIASKAFYHDGNVYVWGVFSGVSSGLITAQLQNTYFLFRSDGFLVSKAVSNQAGGFASTTGHLPSVQSLGSNRWAWAGVLRNIIPLGQGQKGYAAKSPQEIIFEFDANEARRTAQLGETLYVTGGQLSQYDGQNMVEVGFHVFPWDLSITPTAGALTGIYNWQQTYSWFNAKGEFERSTTASIYDQQLTAHQGNIIGQSLHVTAKKGGAGEVACEFWRGVADADVGTPFYLVTSKDPATGTGDNCYVENDTTLATMTTFVDDMADATLIAKEPFPEAGGAILENLTAPSATIIHATQDRLILAGIAGRPHRVAYSKLRGEGEIATFHEALTVELPPEGGVITAIGFLNETLIVFKERAIYALPGDGFDNGGGGANYGPARVLSNDVGATSADTVALTPKGIVFHTNKGWYLLNRGWSAVYIGGPVADFDSDTYVAAFTMESQHQVRLCSTSRVLCWDYLTNQWSEWSPADVVHSVVWGGVHHYASSAGTGDDVMAQQVDWTGNVETYGIDVETAWIKLDDLQGYQRIREIAILGEYRSASTLRVRVAYNYDDSTWTDDTHWTITPTTVGGPMQVVHSPSVQKCQSVKIRVTARNTVPDNYPTGEAFKLSGVQLEYALKRSRFKRLPAGQKQ